MASKKTANTEKPAVLTWKVVFGFLLAVLAFIISNQLVQPILVPRLSTFEVSEPLYIQGNFPDVDTDHYQVFKIKYTIEPSILGEFDALDWDWTRKISLILPGADTHPERGVALMQEMKESNPYAYFEIPREFEDSWIIPTEKLNQTIVLKLTAGGLSLRSFTTTLYFTQKIELDTVRKDGTTPKWTSNSATHPELRPSMERVSSDQLCGYYRVSPNITHTYLFSQVTITNKNTAPVRGFVLDLPPGSRVCEGKYGINTGQYKKDELVTYDYIFIDIEPSQTRAFTTYQETKICPSGFQSFNITTFWCSDLNEKLG